MKNKFILLIAIILLAGCATSGGVDYAQLAAAGEDVFAGKNWNAPRRNNMYDRWEFRTDGTFHFIHVHEGKPLDRGIYRYELNNGTISITKEGETRTTRFTYEFSGKTVTITPVEQRSVRFEMGALPEAPVTFTHKQ